MDRSRIVYLIAEEHFEDAFGVLQAKQKRRKCFANVQSVTSTEWFEGGRNGLNPELRITMFEYDYAGEEIVEYNGVKYTVYRTYTTNTNEIELYVQKKIGNGTNDRT